MIIRIFLDVVVAPRDRVSNIRPDGRADGHKVHPYSNPDLLAFWGINCGKMGIIIFFCIFISMISQL